MTQSWVEDGQKYAFVGLDVKFEGTLPLQKLTPHLWAFTDARFAVPAHWREWLGTVRTEEVEDCNLFLLSKLTSASADILDAENQALQHRAWTFYVGLLLSSAFAPSHQPVFLTGSRRAGEIDIRQQQAFDSPVPSIIRPYPPVHLSEVQLAASLGENLASLGTAPIPGGRWRFNRTLKVYTDARTSPEIVDRIHQYCRCIDGLILPDQGRTKQQFKSKTELFIGPGHHDLVGELYDVRSAVEHLHEYRYLEKFDRAVRLDLVRKEAIAEYIARDALARVIRDPQLWHQFGNTPALVRFWSLPPDERRGLWGKPLDPMAAIANFDPQFINDGELGAP